MTRILGKQVNDPRTKYSRLVYTGVQGTAFTDLNASTINAVSVSDTQGGSDLDTPPRIISTATEPFVLTSGTIGIRINGGAVTPVPLLSTDDTTSKILKKINTAVGFTLASWFEGKLMLKSSSVLGTAGSIELSNISGTILSVLGLPVGITTGHDSGTRGVLTEAVSDFGGRVTIRQVGNKSITTDAANFVQSNDATGNPTDIQYNPQIIGGLPVFARIGRNGSNYRFRYFASAPANAEIHTAGGDFTLIDATDTLNIQIEQNSVTRNLSFSFLAGPNDRDTVIDRINERWGNLIGVPNARVQIRGSVSQPYDFIATDSFFVSVNGAAEVLVSLNSGHRTVSDVITALSAVPNLVATAVSNSGQTTLQLTTSTGVGFKSSITLREIQNSVGFSPNALAKLGFSAGTYIGPHIAKLRGQFEITFLALNRGSQSSVVVDTNGSSTTATRMGLSLTQTSSPSNDPVDIPVVLPRLTFFGQDENSGSNLTTSIFIDSLFPEVLSFGEISADYLSGLEEFGSSVTNTNTDTRKEIVQIEDYNSYPNSFSNLLKFGGQAVTMRPDGQIDMGLMRKSTDFFMRYVKQFIDANFNTGVVSSILTSQISTPGFNGNAVGTSPAMTFLIDPTADHSASSRTLDIKYGGSSTAAYSFKETVATFQGQLDIGTQLAAVLNDSINQPRVIYRLNASSERQLIWISLAGSGRGRIRAYANSNANGRATFEITNNAFWDGTNWNEDFTSSSSVRWIFAGDTGVDGFIMQTHSGASVFLDSDWVEQVHFPTEPEVGDENSFSRILKLGEAYISGDTGADAETPRLVSDQHASDPNIDRTLLWEIPTAGGARPAIRIYAATNSILSTSGQTGFEVTYNCKWDNATALWSNDVAGFHCSKFYIGEGGFALRNTDTFSSLTTFEDIDSSFGWFKTGNPGKIKSSLLWKALAAGTTRTVDFNFDGPLLFSNESFNVLPSNAHRNALYANILPKIMGRVHVDFGVVTQVDGYACPTPTIVGNEIVFSWHFTPDDHTQVIFSYAQVRVSNLIADLRIAHTVETSATDFRFRFFDPATGFTVPLASTDLSFSFVGWYTA